MIQRIREDKRLSDAGITVTTAFYFCGIIDAIDSIISSGSVDLELIYLHRAYAAFLTKRAIIRPGFINFVSILKDTRTVNFIKAIADENT